MKKYISFLIFAQDIDRVGVHLRTTSVRRLKRVPTIYFFEQKQENVAFYHLKIQVVTAMKTGSILHGRVIVMVSPRL